jgi:hypothetical protein
MNYKLIISVLIVLSVLVVPELLFAADDLNNASPNWNKPLVSAGQYFIWGTVIVGALLTLTGIRLTVKYKKLFIKSFIMIFIGLVFLGFTLFNEYTQYNYRNKLEIKVFK